MLFHRRRADTVSVHRFDVGGHGDRRNLCRVRALARRTRRKTALPPWRMPHACIRVTNLGSEELDQSARRLLVRPAGRCLGCPRSCQPPGKVSASGGADTGASASGCRRAGAGGGVGSVGSVFVHHQQHGSDSLLHNGSVPYLPPLPESPAESRSTRKTKTHVMPPVRTRIVGARLVAASRSRRPMSDGQRLDRVERWLRRGGETCLQRAVVQSVPTDRREGARLVEDRDRRT